MISRTNALVLNAGSPLVFQPTLACLLGLVESIFVQQLHYLSVSKKTNGVTHDGNKWIYNTVEAWHEFFPFVSKKTIHNTILRLEKIGIIESRLLRKNRNDRTKFYRVVYDKLEALVLGENTTSDAPIGQSIEKTLDTPSCKIGILLYKENAEENAIENEKLKNPIKQDIQDEAMVSSNDVLLKHLKNGKFPKGELDYKPTASNFEKMWYRTVPEHNNVGFIPKFTMKDLGQAKLLMKALEDKPIQHVEKVISNWAGFCAYCRTMAGDSIKTPPLIPNLGFLLSNVVHIRGYTEQGNKAVQSIAQNKAKNDLIGLADSKKITEVEVPATLEETMAILNGEDE